MLIILCTIANVLLLGGSIQAFRAARKQTEWAERFANVACERADYAKLHANDASEQATKAEEHSKTTQYFAGVRLVTDEKDHSSTGSNIGKRR